MALSTQQDVEDSQYLLLAKIDNARNVSNILKAIHFKEVKYIADSNLGFAHKHSKGIIKVPNMIVSLALFRDMFDITILNITHFL